jgi:hypothetical protein
VVLQLSSLEGLCGAGPAARRPGQTHGRQRSGLGVGEKHIQQRADGGLCPLPGQPEHQESGGEWGLGLTDLARDQIVNAVGYRLIPLYRLIGPKTVIVILVMFIIGMARMLVDILVRVMIITRVRGWGFWMFGALWDTAFQVAVSPFRWAVEKGKEGPGRIKNQMEARAAYAGVGNGGESADNVEVLADWAASWRRRVYGVVPSAELPLEARPGTGPLRVVGANLPTDGGGSATIN